MKRKTLLIIAVSYIGLIIVIAVIGLSVSKERESLNSDTISPGQIALSDTLETDTRVRSQTAVEQAAGTVEERPSQSDGLTNTPTPEITQTHGTMTPSVSITRTRTSTVALSTPTGDPYPVNGENTPTITQQSYPIDESVTSTRTPTRTQTPTRTATSNQTATPQTGWGGEWTIFWENDDGSYSMDEIQVVLNGDEISAQARINDFTYDFIGEIVGELDLVEGLWESDTMSGFFYWEFIAEDSFGGNWNNAFGFCGVRPGNDQPDDCKIILDIR